jgi:N-acetylglucosamine kinase-like BadF-type ATPase
MLQNEEPLILGVDGGQTATKGILVDLRGEILAIAQGMPVRRIKNDNTRYSSRLLSGLLKNLFNDNLLSTRRISLGKPENYKLAGAHLGLTGVFNSEAEEAGIWLAVSAKILGSIPIVIDSDIYSAWAGANLGRHGIVLCAGTGSIAMGGDENGQFFRAGGWGNILSDEGSAYWIGLSGIKAVFKAWDKMENDTELWPEAQKHFRLSTPRDLRDLVYSKDLTVDQIASFAQNVSRCAGNGDPIARKICKRAGTELAKLVVTVATRLKNEGYTGKRMKISLCGGIFAEETLITASFHERVNRFFQKSEIEYYIQKPELPPVAGSALLCLRKFFRLQGRGDIPDEVILNLKKSWKEIKKDLNGE